MKTEFLLELDEKTKACDEIVRGRLPQEEGMQKTVLSAMRYSVEAGGKRIRPLLISECYALQKPDAERDRLLRPVMEAFMAGMEMIHTFSLCHDDLPCMDNDAYRRGRESTWYHFGEDMGTLAGDALSLYAFEAVGDACEKMLAAAEAENVPAERLFRYSGAALSAMRLLAGCSGVYGMLGGQVADVELTGRALTEEQLSFIYRLKTGALIAGSMRIGALLGGADAETQQSLHDIGEKIGIAFQIQDDILDETSTTEVLGKPIHSDEENGKTTYVSLHGLAASEKEVERLSMEAAEALKSRAAQWDAEHLDFLLLLTEYLIHRKK